MQVLTRYVVRGAKFVLGGAALGVLLGVVVAETAGAQTTSGVASASESSIDASRIWTAVVFVLASVSVIAIGLYWSYSYHRRLLGTIDAAIAKGVVKKVDVENIDSLGPRTRGSKQIGVSGPSQAVAGEAVTFTATGIQDAAGVNWTVSGAGATPESGTGASIVVTFAGSGKATVAPHLSEHVSSPLEVTVTEPPPPGSAEGIVLPFVLRNWARFVVVIFGVGAIAGLMALSIISAEGGIGLLGALLGIGGAAASDADSKPAGGSGGGSTT